MSNYVFVGAMSGKGKESGKAYNMVRLIGKTERGDFRVWELFTAEGKKLDGQDNLKFGDVVNAEFTTADYPGARSTLSGLMKVSDSPYNQDTLALI